MNISGILPLLATHPIYQSFLDEIRSGESDRAPLSLYGAARPALVASLALELGRPLVYLLARSEHARQAFDELQVWLPPGEGTSALHLLADPDALPYERIPWSRETRQSRLAALTALSGRAGGEAPPLVVASARALMQQTLPPRELRLSTRPLRVGQALDLSETLRRWLGLGYRTDAVVEEVGQISRRGGIVDIWPPNLPWPVRIELFGDEVDSLRHFDPTTQRTIPDARNLAEVLVGPASEALPRFGELAMERLDQLDQRPMHPPARNELDSERQQLAEATGFKGQEWYIPYLYSQPASALDYLPEDVLLVVDDGAEFMSLVIELEAQAGQNSSAT